MRKSGSFLCLVCALLCSAPLSAQPLPVRQLEERVAQELLSEGTSLARLGLRLVVRPVEPDIELELVEIESGRLLASRRVTDLPSDTDAAIAHLTVLAGSLVRTVRPDPPAPPPPPSPAVAPRIEKPPAPDPLEQAREEYGRRQVGFDDVITVRGWGSVFKVESVGTPYRGTMHAPLRGAEFYSEIGRPDLASRYRARRNGRIAGFVVGGAAVTVGLLLLAESESARFALSDCDIFADDYQACEAAFQKEQDDRADEFALWGGVTLAAGGVACLVAALSGNHPVSESERYRMAEEYNASLKRQLGLGAVRRPVSLSPYAAPGGGGLVLRGTF